MPRGTRPANPTGDAPAGSATEPRPAGAHLARVERGARLIATGLGGALAIAGLLILPDLIRATPFEIQCALFHPLVRITPIAGLLVFGPARIAALVPRRRREALAAWARRALQRPPIAAVAVAVAAAALAPRAGNALALPLPGPLARLDRYSARVLAGPASVAAAGACALLWLTWAPHYLTWPWWSDADQFAVAAQLWDAGIPPYLDHRDFDFPGPVYVHYLLGKVFGWGRTPWLYALDASFVAILGIALAAWSRRLFGTALPGLVGALPFLCFHLGHDLSMAVQRDWHAPLFVVLGLLALDAWPGRPGRLAAAAGLAAALAYRPHAIVFLPALAAAAAVDKGGRPADASRSRAIAPLAEWSALAATALLLAYSPLILAGVMDDFLRNLGTLRTGTYNHNAWFLFWDQLTLYLREPRILGSLVPGLLLAVAGPPWLRRPARTWALALLGVLFYKPMSPFPHEYLDQPLRLIQAVNLAILVAWLLKTPRLAATWRFAALAAVLASGGLSWPEYCRAGASLRALGPLARSEDPVEVPPGGARAFSTPERPSDRYAWSDYRALLAYLRRSTPPGTRVANLLWNVPFPPTNGTVARPTPFPSAGGYIHLWMVAPDLLDEYVAVLERNHDIVVVWGPGQPNPFFPKLDEVVRRNYRPHERFGGIEVWRHVDLPVDVDRSSGNGHPLPRQGNRPAEHRQPKSRTDLDAGQAV